MEHLAWFSVRIPVRQRAVILEGVFHGDLLRQLVAADALHVLQHAYAIGEARPVSILVNTFGTGKIDDRTIETILPKYFDLSSAGLSKMLDLKKPGYASTAALGHFGRKGKRFTWEKTDKASALKKEVLTLKK